LPWWTARPLRRLLSPLASSPLKWCCRLSLLLACHHTGKMWKFRVSVSGPLRKNQVKSIIKWLAKSKKEIRKK
jgi:hypothetical protein